MNIPNLPHFSIPVVTSDGGMHTTWYQYFTQLNNELQANQSQEGNYVPLQSTANISSIESKSPLPNFLYDSDLNVLKVAINGVYKTVTTS